MKKTKKAEKFLTLLSPGPKDNSLRPRDHQKGILKLAHERVLEKQGYLLEN